MGMRAHPLLLLLSLSACATYESQFPAEVRCDWPNEHPLDFYTAPVEEDLVALPLGELLRVQHVFRANKAALGLAGAWGSPHGAEVYRVLYRSQGEEGEPAVLSARIAVPNAEPPDGGFPVVAHLHGTSSLGDRCAPSKVSLAFGFESLLNPLAARMIAAGRIVVMTDYLGLGTEGEHPYVVAEPTATAAWDSVRAAHRLCDASRGVVWPPSDETLLEGHSQGAHAALAAWDRWSELAPEFELVGAVAMAPPPAPLALAEAMALGEAPTAPVALGLYGMTRWYDELGGLEPWLQPDIAADFEAQVDGSCAAWLGVWLDGDPEEIFNAELLAGLEAGEPSELLATVLEGEDLSQGGSESPLFVVHGDEDELFPPGLVEDLVAGLREGGSEVEFHSAAGVGHLTVPAEAEDTVLAWIDAR